MKHQQNFSCILMPLLLVAIHLISCTNTDDAIADTDGNNRNLMEIVANIGEPKTRISSMISPDYNYEDNTYSYNETFSWQIGDEIGIITSDNKVVPFVNVDGSDTFRAISTGISKDQSGTVFAFYPYKSDFYGYIDSEEITQNNVFLGEGFVNADGECYLSFKPATTKIVLNTYNDYGTTPMSIDSITISGHRYYRWLGNGKWDESNGDESIGEVELLEDPEISSEYTYTFNNGKREITSYAAQFAPFKSGYDWWGDSIYDCKLKYKVYNVFNVEKNIKEKLNAGTLYEIPLKVPCEPSFEKDYSYGKVNVKFYLPEGFDTRTTNLSHYVMNLYRCHIGSGRCDLIGRYNLSELEAENNAFNIEQGEDEFFSPGYGLGYYSTRYYRLKIFKDDDDNMPCFETTLGLDVPLLASKWVGVESWTGQDGNVMTKTYENINIAYNSVTMPDHILYTYEINDFINNKYRGGGVVFGNDDDLSIEVCTNTENGEFYLIKGKYSKVADKETITGKIIHYIKGIDWHKPEYSHDFVMTAINDD